MILVHALLGHDVGEDALARGLFGDQDRQIDLLAVAAQGGPLHHLPRRVEEQVIEGEDADLSLPLPGSVLLTGRASLDAFVAP